MHRGVQSRPKYSRECQLVLFEEHLRVLDETHVFEDHIHPVLELFSNVVDGLYHGHCGFAGSPVVLHLKTRFLLGLCRYLTFDLFFCLYELSFLSCLHLLDYLVERDKTLFSGRLQIGTRLSQRLVDH